MWKSAYVGVYQLLYWTCVATTKHSDLLSVLMNTLPPNLLHAKSCYIRVNCPPQVVPKLRDAYGRRNEPKHACWVYYWTSGVSAPGHYHGHRLIRTGPSLNYCSVCSNRLSYRTEITHTTHRSVARLAGSVTPPDGCPMLRDDTLTMELPYILGSQYSV